MSRIRLRRPSLGTTLGALALFVALGGPAQAAKLFDGGDIKNNSVASKDIKNRSIAAKDVKRNGLGGGQINEARLGRVPSAATAGSATTAGNAATLGGTPPSGFLPAGALALPAPTLPALEGGWAAYGLGFLAPGHFRDAAGLVHLQGTVDGGVDPLVFILPAGLRPPEISAHPIACADDAGYLEIGPDGEVSIFEGSAASNCAAFASLDGVTFRPAP